MLFLQSRVSRRLICLQSLDFLSTLTPPAVFSIAGFTQYMNNTET